MLILPIKTADVCQKYLNHHHKTEKDEIIPCLNNFTFYNLLQEDSIKSHMKKMQQLTKANHYIKLKIFAISIPLLY